MILSNQLAILGRASRLKRIIKEAQAELTHIQTNICTHPDKTTEWGSSTGDIWSEDQYWKIHDCPDCGRHWTEEQ